MLDLEDRKPSVDVEKDAYSVSEETQDDFHYNPPLMRKLLTWGVEARGTCDLFVKRLFTEIKHISQVYFPSLQVSVRIPTIAKSFSSGGRRISISSREYLDLYIVVHW